MKLSLTCLEHRSSSHLVFCLRFQADFPANAAAEAGRSAGVEFLD